jgi:hypothetical protein
VDARWLGSIRGPSGLGHEDDPHHDGSRACADACGLSFLSVPGDHAQAMAVHAGVVVPRLRALFAEATRVLEQR